MYTLVSTTCYVQYIHTLKITAIILIDIKLTFTFKHIYKRVLFVWLLNIGGNLCYIEITITEINKYLLSLIRHTRVCIIMGSGLRVYLIGK